MTKTYTPANVMSFFKHEGNSAYSSPDRTSGKGAVFASKVGGRFWRTKVGNGANTARPAKTPAFRDKIA